MITFFVPLEYGLRM